VHQRRVARAHATSGGAAAEPPSTAAPKAQGAAKVAEDPDSEAKSLRYSKEMQAKMGTQDTYQHELGLNYNRVIEDVIVGSCLQEAEDVDHLLEQEGVKLIFCLQEDSDMAYFNLDIKPIEARCKELGVRHVRFRVHDFDPFDLRKKLPDAVAALAGAHAATGGTAYVHCTAGMGRAPATAVAYMSWARGMQVDEAYTTVTSIRRCSPKIDAIRSAAADVLMGMGPVPVCIAVYRHSGCQRIQVAGLDVGWGNPLDMEWCPRLGRWQLQREMLLGQYQYKLIMDGVWTYSADHPTMSDGFNTNNLLEVDADVGPAAREQLRRILTPGAELTGEEKAAMRARVGVA